MTAQRIRLLVSVSFHTTSAILALTLVNVVALNNEKKAHEGNWIFPELVIDIYCGKHPTEESACMLKTNPHNPTGPKVTAFATSWTDRGWFWNTYNIVLCPRFFVEKDSLWKRLSLMKYGNSSPTNASEYKLAWGHTIYHELMHLDPVIAQDEVWDVTYGACNVARLAKKNGCTGDSKWPGWNPGLGKANSMNNADSWAMFASAAYFQSVLKLDSPGTAPDCDLSSTDIEPADVEGILLPPGDMVSTLQTAKVPPDPDPSQIPAPDGPTPVLPIDANSPPSGLATPYADAVAYFDKMTISSPPTPSSSTSSEACIGNQVQGTCMAGSLPSAAPYSGTQGPSCEKDFGGAGSTGPRLNSDKASQAANNWCAARISEGLVLDGNSGNPKADVTKSVAEGGKDMVLNVMFDVTACPSDKSKTTLNFTALGQQNCGQDLYTAIETVCQEDRTWANFNKDFTLQGGVFGADCGLWSIYGQ